MKVDENGIWNGWESYQNVFDITIKRNITQTTLNRTGVELINRGNLYEEVRQLYRRGFEISVTPSYTIKLQTRSLEDLVREVVEIDNVRQHSKYNAGIGIPKIEIRKINKKVLSLLCN